MSQILDTILAWTFWSVGAIAGFTVWYEVYTNSNRYNQKRIERRKQTYNDERKGEL